MELFVGRQDEQTEFKNRFDKLRQGSGGIILVSGEAGVGNDEGDVDDVGDGDDDEEGRS